jgi:hypothetical protein
MTPISKEQAFQRGLPKWPQMLVKGQTITVEQAKEIIFATDTSMTSPYSCSTNDRKFKKWFLDVTGYNQLLPDYMRDDFQYPQAGTPAAAEQARRNEVFYAREEAFTRRAGFLRHEYVHNTWCSSCFVDGPYGWCHPDGTISFVYNVGKWPSVEQVHTEWSEIAARWTFLDLWVTLMNGESGEEPAPVVTFHVHNGIVECFDGTTEPFAGLPGPPEFDPLVFAAQMRDYTYAHEHGLPEPWVDEFVDRVRPIIDQVVKEFPL